MRLCVSRTLGIVGLAAAFSLAAGAPVRAQSGAPAPASSEVEAPAPAQPTPLVPGAPVGVELVRGDLSVAASGTVTRVDDDVVYAFGHPFFGSGPVEMPMATAEVVHTLADWSGSYHMIDLGPSVGDQKPRVVGARDQVVQRRFALHP